MALREPPPNAAHDLLLVLGVAAVVLGVVLGSRAVLPSPSAAHRVPPTPAARGWVERLVPAQDARSIATTPPTDRGPTASAPPTASSDATTGVAACAPRFDPDHDLRLVLAAMALQRRRTMGKHPVASFHPPDKEDVPESVVARAKGAVTPAEASPPAARRPTGPSC